MGRYGLTDAECKAIEPFGEGRRANLDAPRLGAANRL